MVNTAPPTPAADAKSTTFTSKREEESGQSRQRFEAEHVNDFINNMTSGGRAHIVAEHDELRKKERHISYFVCNREKNRFSNVILFNECAVRLKRNNQNETDYINATEIRAKLGHFIMAQAPRNDTLVDWYRMMWQRQVQIIVCLLPLDNLDDCCKYFEKKQGKKVKKGRFTFKTFSMREDGAANLYEMRFINNDLKGDEKERIIHIVHFPNWSLQKPPATRDLVKLIRSVWSIEHSLKLGKEESVVVLVHGITGTRRSGTYVIASMLCRQLRDKKVVSLLPACATVRRYRYGVMRNRVQFCILLEVIIQFACDVGMLDRKNHQVQQALKKIQGSMRLKKSKEESVHDTG